MDSSFIGTENGTSMALYSSFCIREYYNTITITINNCNFTANMPEYCGYLTSSTSSKVIVHIQNTTFQNNSGGAIFARNTVLYLHDNALYVEDSIENCHNDRFSLLQFSRSDWKIFFTNNTAFKGPILYGKNLLSNCSYDYLNRFGISPSTRTITSDAVNVCFCNDESKANCSLRQKELSAYRGQLISFNVTTLTRCGNFTPSLLDNCDDLELILGKGKCYQNISKTCKEVKFRVSCKDELTGNLTLKLKGPCRDINKLTVQIMFKDCPRGFQLDTSEEDFYKCNCDKRLKDFGSKLVCQIDSGTLNYQGILWFQYKNKTLEVCKTCPFDYCNKTITSLYINESQCANNRYGVVCGACKDSFSLALGSSRCINCSKKYNFWIVPLFVVIGLIIVLGMLFLDLTVSIGLINGLIFYANILSISGLTKNCSIHPLLSIFISWINLDLGIHMCFYSGMDMYQKTWLQFAFPLYIWLLVGLIIILSHYSTRVMRLLGRRVIPALATPFLLSYARILKTVITVFSFVEVFTGDADNTSDELVSRKVWTHDGNVDFLSGKHIPLFIVALLFLVVFFLPYTLLLTFGQCLRSLPRRKGFRWLHSTAVIFIMDAYHAPFNRNHRYWTGLLLIINCILLIIFVTTYDDENAIRTNIFIISIVTIGIILLKASLANRIYAKKSANNLENIFIFNLLLLAVATLYLDDINGYNRCAYITASISVAFMTFLIIIACQIYYKMKGYSALKRFIHKTIITRKVETIKRTQQEDTPTFTSTTVELRESLLETVNEEM